MNIMKEEIYKCYVTIQKKKEREGEFNLMGK